MFVDRIDAGKKLGEALSELMKLRSHAGSRQPSDHPCSDLSGSKILVLGIPRGGVSVGIQVANYLDADFDVLLAKKIRAPNSPEFAIGAVSESGAVFLDDSSVVSSGAADSYIKGEIEHQRKEIQRRRDMLSDLLSVQLIRGRSVIVVDDGIATGSTLLAGLKTIKLMEPNEIIVAVPVAPLSAERTFAPHCNEYICLLTPEPFYAVGQAYDTFGQVDDSSMIEMIRRHLPERH